MRNYSFFVKNNYKIKPIVLFVLIIPLIPLEGLYYINKNIFNIIYMAFTAVDALVILVLWFSNFLITRKLFSHSSMWLLLLIMYNVLHTFSSKGDLRAVIGIWLFTVPMILLVEINNNDLYTLLKVILIYLEFLLVIDLMMVLMKPNGIFQGNSEEYGKIWILGYKSSLQCYVYPVVIIALLLTSYTNKYKNTIFILIILNFEKWCIYFMKFR